MDPEHAAALRSSVGMAQPCGGSAWLQCGALHAAVLSGVQEGGPSCLRPRGLSVLGAALPVGRAVRGA